MLEPLMVRSAFAIELSRLRLLLSVAPASTNFCRLHRTLHCVFPLANWLQSVGGAQCGTLAVTQSSSLCLSLLIYKQSIIIDSAALSSATVRSYDGFTNQTSTARDLVLSSTIKSAKKRTAAQVRAHLHPASVYFRSVCRHARRDIGIQVPHLYLRRPGRSHVQQQVSQLHSTAGSKMVTSSLPLRKTSNRFLSAFLIIYYLFEGLLTFWIPESWRQKDVTDQIILITGGGSGIGQLTAIKFLELGAKVVIWDVSSDGMDKTVQMMREAQLDTSKVFCYKINLSDRNAIYQTAKRVQQDVGSVQILINNAGVVSGQSFLDIPDEKIQLTMDVNTMAHFWTCKAFLPDMVKRNKGHIVTVASVAGNLAGCNMSDYHASKFANVGFDLALRMELAQADLDGIKTSIVKPYFITTGMFSGVRTDLIPFLKPDYVATKIVSGIRAETRDIVIPYYFVHFFWLIVLFPAKCLVPMGDFLGGYDFMSHFEGRQGPQKNEINNNTFIKNGVNNNNNTETKKAN